MLGRLSRATLDLTLFSESDASLTASSIAGLVLGVPASWGSIFGAAPDQDRCPAVSDTAALQSLDIALVESNSEVVRSIAKRAERLGEEKITGTKPSFSTNYGQCFYNHNFAYGISGVVGPDCASETAR
jgi:hypothetical protein